MCSLCNELRRPSLDYVEVLNEGRGLASQSLQSHSLFFQRACAIRVSLFGELIRSKVGSSIAQPAPPGVSGRAHVPERERGLLPSAVLVRLRCHAGPRECAHGGPPSRRQVRQLPIYRAPHARREHSSKEIALPGFGCLPIALSRHLRPRCPDLAEEFRTFRISECMHCAAA